MLHRAPFRMEGHNSPVAASASGCHSLLGTAFVQRKPTHLKTCPLPWGRLNPRLAIVRIQRVPPPQFRPTLKDHPIVELLTGAAEFN